MSTSIRLEGQVEGMDAKVVSVSDGKLGGVGNFGATVAASALVKF